MKNDSARMLSKRTQVVWAAFFLVIPTVLFVLLLGNNDMQVGVLLTTLAPVEERPDEDPVFSNIDNPSDWLTIVVQHLGQPAGSAELIDRNHRNIGLEGLGYHFLIGNGNGLGDGDVHIGYRWIKQIAAAKPGGVDEPQWNKGVISICLIGNGNRRPFTDQQILHLSHLVQRLQQQLSIPSSNVFLASDVGSDQTSPGKHFAEAQFRGQLLDIPGNN
ncbi:MAG: N-acetylmuramoyl-L-alanine amidase [Phycisphaerales bacterium]|jgi:hypothetical protein|nr:N-acetylmuramoyl-L-alanine amidase [Phycisphaerales bacterium]